MSSRGKEVAGKLYQNFDCKCKKKCVENMPEVARREIFDTFWKLNSFSEQNVFLCCLIVQKTSKSEAIALLCASVFSYKHSKFRMGE